MTPASHPTITLYGIPNCDTVKKARDWLTGQGLAYQFHDFKKAGVPHAEMDLWLAAVGWETLLNRKGTMWRKLDPATQAAVVDAASAKSLMLVQPSVIKRPVVRWETAHKTQFTVGFKPENWSKLATQPH